MFSSFKENLKQRRWSTIMHSSKTAVRMNGSLHFLLVRRLEEHAILILPNIQLIRKHITLRVLFSSLTTD